MIQDIEAEVHKQLENGLRLKVSLPSIGMYINGFRAMRNKEDKGWYILPPQQKAGFKWINIIEFDKSSEVWKEICCVCIQKAEEYSKYIEIEEVSDGAKSFEDLISDRLDTSLNNLDADKKPSSGYAIPWLKDE